LDIRDLFSILCIYIYKLKQKTMAYFNHAFNKAFLLETLTSKDGGKLGTPGNILAKGELAVVDAKTWDILSTESFPETCCNIVIANGSLYQNDKIGPFHGGYQESNKSKQINPKYVSRVYTVQANLPQQNVINIGNTPYTTSLDPLVPACCKTFFCGETYTLRVDIKGSPALRFLNHNAYLNVDHYTGCCPEDAITPVAVDSTLVMIGWAKQLADSPIMSPFVLPVVVAEDGTLYYKPGTLDENGNPFANTWDTYVSPGHTEDACAGLILYGAYVDTKFGDCTFQVSDFYEKEPVRLYASEVDLNGDPCTFDGICVITECEGLQANGLGETVLRELVVSESYRQSFMHSDLRIREITQGDQIVAAVNRNAYYDRLYIQHNVPRFNNPTGTFDNDQYLLQIFALAGSAEDGIVDGTINPTVRAFYDWLYRWLETCGTVCQNEEITSFTECEAVVPVVPQVG
jgi:hypothetical protein